MYQLNDMMYVSYDPINWNAKEQSFDLGCQKNHKDTVFLACRPRIGCKYAFQGENPASDTSKLFFQKIIIFSSEIEFLF